MSKIYDPSYPYIGVGIFKLPASHPFNHAAYLHDRAYESWPCQSTAPIDLDFYFNCVDIVTQWYMDAGIGIEEFVDYVIEARRCYKLTRIWGTTRYCIAKLLGWKYLLGNEKP